MHNLGLFIFVVFVTCVTPGSGVLYTLHNAFNYGLKNAVLSPTGNALGVLSMSVLAASGLGAIIQASPPLFYGLQSIGALLLFYFGWKSWVAPPVNLAAAEAAAGNKGSKNARRILFSAALLQVTNPMLIVFLLSLLPQFIDPNIDYARQITILIGIFVGICWLVHIVYSYSAPYAATKLMGPRFSFWLNKVSAVLFFLLGGSVLLHTAGIL